MSTLEDSSKGATGAVADGYEALARRDWEQARSSFESALADAEAPETLEGLSWALWWLNDAEPLFATRERAYSAYRDAGDALGAARMATWLGTDHVDIRGELAVAHGWLGRARRLLEDLDPAAEHGWLWIHEAEKLIFANETEQARELALAAAKLGRELGSIDLEMMALATEGLALVTEGEIEAGASRLDEAAGAAIAGELREVWAMGWCLCYVIYACERARDYDRAAQWCKRAEEWSERMKMAALAPSCRAHYAGVLIWRGTWDEAEDELVRSAEQLADVRPPMAAEATVRLAELRRRQGRLDEAAELFEAVAEHPLALLGLSEVCLDRGEAASARDWAEQYLRDVPAATGTLRASGLELLTRAHAALGETEAARAATDELSAIADSVDTNPLRASAAFCAGVAAGLGNDWQTARRSFEDATRLFHRAGAPFEAGRSRAELARALAGLGRAKDAMREAKAAATSLRRIGAEREAERASALGAGAPAPSAASPLTNREAEVLRLVAGGKTNREIAEELVLSEHTINRHISNILAKLGAPSRSAAVAEALKAELI